MHQRITRRTFTRAGLATAVALPFTGRRAWAQAWPAKPIKIVCTAAPGGLPDLLARAYGEYLSRNLGQAVVVENKPGVGGALAAQAVKATPADGYTLLFAPSTTMIANRVLYKNLAYDPDKDFVLISTMSPGSFVFVAHKSTGATNVREFVDYARRNKTSVGTWGAGSGAHMVVAELNKQFGLQIEAVHYRGLPPAFQDLNAGVIQAAVSDYNLAVNSLQSGTGRAIAAYPRRSSKLPDVPTFQEQGVNSRMFDLRGYICLAGPSAMPQEIVERLSALMVEGGKSERVQRLLDTLGIDEAAVGHVEARAAARGGKAGLDRARQQPGAHASIAAPGREDAPGTSRAWDGKQWTSYQEHPGFLHGLRLRGVRGRNGGAGAGLPAGQRGAHGAGVLSDRARAGPCRHRRAGAAQVAHLR